MNLYIMSRMWPVAAACFFFALSSLRAQDDPTLINITTLEQLCAVRYDMDGNGEPDVETTAAEKVNYRTAFVLTNIDDCAGYELMNGLDFNDTDPLTAGNQPSKWAKGCSGPDCVTGTQADKTTGNTGWEPIDHFYFDDRGTPLDDSDDVRVDVSFSSTFQGNGNTISGLYINRRGSSDFLAGLFGRIASGAILDNLALVEVEVNMTGTSDSSFAGGLVGQMDDGSITASCVAGEVTSTSTYGYSAAGGLVGQMSNSGSITASYVTGEVTAINESPGSFALSFAGGLVGYMDGDNITASYATGDVTAINTNTGTLGDSYAGGLVGYMDGGNITASYAAGDVTGTSGASFVGGLVGYIVSGNITASYATGNFTTTSTGTSGYSYAGGFVGYMGGGDITASYAAGNFTATSTGTSGYSYAGGFVGSMGGGNIIASYVTGDVTATSTGILAGSSAGGLVGYMNSSASASVTASYYDSEATITAGKRTTEGAQTRSALQTPTAGSGIYATWVQLELDDGALAGIDDRTEAGDLADDLIWDFGTSSEYPALKVDFDADATATEKATVAEFGPQRAPKFRQATYYFVVEIGAVAGTVAGMVQANIAHDAHTLSYSIVSQTLDGTPATAFDIADEEKNGAKVGGLSVAVSAVLMLDQVYALTVQVDGNGSTDMAEVRVQVVTVAPAAPTGFVVTAESETQIKLQWVAPTGTGGAAITGYQIQRSLFGKVGTFTNLHMITDPATLTYQHMGLIARTEYHYQVAAINSVGTGDYTSAVSAITHGVPDAPTAFVATAESETQIKLQWVAPTDTGGFAITGYHIQNSPDGNVGTFTTLHMITDPTTLTYQHMGLIARTEYHYQVAAINSVGTGDYAGPISTTTHGGVPDAPTGFVVTAESETQIKLQWVAPTRGGFAITGYQIQNSPDGNVGTFTDLHTVTNPATLTYQHTGLLAGTEYYYQIAAINSVGTGDYTSAVSATTHVPTVHDVPGAPTGFVATAESSTQIDLQWVAPTTGGAAITGYQIQRSPDGNVGTFTNLPVANPATLTYQHTGLLAGTEYYYQIAAINSVGTGDYTSAVSATTHVPTVFFSSATYTASESSGIVDILLETSTAPGASVRVFIEVLAAGTTAQPADYTLPTPSEVLFKVGETSKAFAITLQDDDLYEGDEILWLSIIATDRLEVGAVSVSVLTIIDDERIIDDKVGALSSSVHRGGSSISLYPNPVVDALRVHSLAVGRLLVYDFTGTLLGTYALSAGVNSLSFSEYDQGVYVLQALLPSGERFHRIVKE